MKLDELFDILIKKIPYTNNTEQSFHQNLHDEFEEYFKRLKTLNNDEFVKMSCSHEKDITRRKFITIEKKICKNIEDIIFHVRNGDSYTAYKMLHSLLENKVRNLSDKLYNYFEIDFSDGQKEFYRVRNIGKTYTFPNSMKHCPFESVHNLSNYRFSISGFPCLYLGSSLKVCKVETLKQEKKEYHKALFELKDNIKKTLLLNLVPPSDSSNSQELFNFLLLYPFYLACLTQVKDAEGAFHPEYILPQLLLSFVRKEGLLHGIKYLSVHVTCDNNLSEMINYVFPVKEIKDKGFDEELMSRFEMKEI